MKFLLDSSVFDTDSLPSLGNGSYGDVLDQGKYAVKIYFDKPEGSQVRKLIKLFDLGKAIQIEQDSAQQVAMPLLPVMDCSDKAMAGFGMNRFPNGIKLSKLIFNLSTGQYWNHKGFQFDDETVVRAIFEMFSLLAVLARHHIAIGDISLANILVDPTTGKPGFIDMDSVQIENMESESLGTDGYVDPNIIDGDTNAAGGYHFDVKTDVFALTVVAFVLFVGTTPFFLHVDPPINERELALKRLSSLKVLVQGAGCLYAHGVRLVDSPLLENVQSRMGALRRVRGRSGKDGDLLYQHFVDVFIEDRRENLLEILPEEDSRSTDAETQRLRLLRSGEVLEDIRVKFGLEGKSQAAPSTTFSPAQRQTMPFIALDPREFIPFLEARGLNLSAMVV